MEPDYAHDVAQGEHPLYFDAALFGATALELVTPPQRSAIPRPVPTFRGGLPQSAPAAQRAAVAARAAGGPPALLSAISRTPGTGASAGGGFVLSPGLQHALSRTSGGGAGRRSTRETDELVRRLLGEIRAFAKEKKEVVRSARKEAHSERQRSLSADENRRMRSRREAEVTREKNRQEDAALKDALRWMIANVATSHPAHCTCQQRGRY